ncbi:MAG: hypothetical protein HON35_02575 [Actinobacteria bacterium]|nr:hypothetical protein [Actinomycetota bacterium]MBT5755222.1 hypothetical protein [Acidimicrobiaceae bacterium]
MSTRQENYSDAAVGWTIFASILLIMIGVFQAISGLVAIVNDTFYVVGEVWIFQFDISTWGWIHLLIGLVLALAGFFLFRGAMWARVVGIVVASIAAIANFAWLPWYPLWSIIIITVSVFVIWALSVHGRDITQAQKSGIS